MSLAGSAPGTTLTVNGNYVGNAGSVLNVTAALDGDTSTTDKLVITGNASGTTAVSVKNVGGTSATTLNGIEVIEVDGTSTATFTQDGRIAAGAFDYALVQKGDDYYLESALSTAGAGGGATEVWRPEAGAYMANLEMANTMFVTDMQDRQGRNIYRNPVTGEVVTSPIWIRAQGSHDTFRDSESGQLSAQSNSYAVQMGGDLFRASSNGINGFHAGVMGGYGGGDSNTRNGLSGYGATSNLNGYTAGIYSTYYHHEQDHAGVYVDTWAQWDHFNARVDGDDLPREHYTLDGLQASVETGYNLKLTSGSTYSSWVQPHVQVIYNGVDGDSFTDSTGTNVRNEGSDNIQTRVGARLFLSSVAGPHQSIYSPYIEANWLHSTRSYGVSFNGFSNSQASANNTAEVLAGLDVQLPGAWKTWAGIGADLGDNNYKQLTAQIGLKYSF